MKSISYNNPIIEKDGGKDDATYMRRAIELAKKGMGYAAPNPMVGAVIVKDGRIIGEGYHKKCGELHAERDAIKNLKESAEGATIYVTLEPCCHYGKQPPCTEAIVENRIAKVVIGSRDPNPLVSGKGTKYLREHGIEVTEDFLRDECDRLNPEFFHYITTGKPYIVLKYAMTADGKIATKTGDSKWITGEKAREDVHIKRSRYSGILAGIGTVLADNPTLNVRLKGDTVPHQPLRIIADSSLRIPTDCNIVKTAGEYETLVACGSGYDEEKKIALEGAGIKVISVPGDDGKVSLKKLIDYLGENKIMSVLVEGGGSIHESFLREGLANHICTYIGPKMFGGADAKSPVEGTGFEKVSDGTNLKLTELKRFDDDILIEYDVIK